MPACCTVLQQAACGSWHQNVVNGCVSCFVLTPKQDNKGAKAPISGHCQIVPAPPPSNQHQIWQTESVSRQIDMKNSV
jgi:hypothetical protein